MTDSLKTAHALDAFVRMADTDHAEDAAVFVEIRPDQQFINVRGDTTDKTLQGAVMAATGAELSADSNTYVTEKNRIYWLGPDEWLVQAGDDDLLAAALPAAAAMSDGCAVDVSDTYVTLSVSGRRATELISMGCTLDLHGEAFTAPACAQTAISRTAILLVREADPETFTVIVRRSFAEYLALWMRNAGKEYGIAFSRGK